MTTFEIIEQLKLISEMKEAVNEETGVFLYSDEEIQAKYAAINADKEIKLNAIEDYKRSIKKDIELYTEKKKKQEANIKRANGDIERLKEFQELLLNGEKLKNDEYTFYYTKSESVEIADLDRVLSSPYVKRTVAVDKTAIKLAIKKGHEVFGAELVEKKSLAVK